MAAARKPRLGAARWRELIDRQVDSGLSLAGFCAQAQLSVASFYQWRTRLRAQAQSGLPRAAAALPDPAPSGFVDLGVLAGMPGAGFRCAWSLEVVLQGG